MAKRATRRPRRPTIAPPPVAIVVSRYNRSVTDRLLEGAIDAYVDRGGRAADAHVFSAPGAFELTVIAAAAAKSGKYGAVVALGCLVKGETRHDEYLGHAVAQGLTNVGIATGVPVAFGVLTVDTPKQAIARAGGEHGNKGAEAMSAAMEAMKAVRHASRGEPAPEASIAVRRDKVAGARA